MNLQNNKDRDQSDSGEAKPENNLAKGSSETTREAPSTTEITAASITEIVEKLDDDEDVSELSDYEVEVNAEVTELEVISSTTLSSLKVVDTISFSDYVNYTNQLSPGVNNQFDFHFLAWFIGFVEGDGHISQRLAKIVSKTTGEESTYIRIALQIGQKDARLIEIIQKKLGFGKTSFYQNKKWGIMHRLTVEKKEHVQRLLHLFNGNLVLPKRYVQFEKWVSMARQKNICPPNFSLKKQRVKVSLKNAWLAGFIESEGCFYAHYRKKTYRGRTSIGYKLDQKVSLGQADTYGEKRVFEEILLLFNSSGQVHVRKDNSVHIELSARPIRRLLIDYFTQFPNFPLLGIKRIAAIRSYRLYLFWEDVLEKRRNEHTTEQEAEKILKQCRDVNKFKKLVK